MTNGGSAAASALEASNSDRATRRASAARAVCAASRPMRFQARRHSVFHRDDAAPQRVADQVGLRVKPEFAHQMCAVRFSGALTDT